MRDGDVIELLPTLARAQKYDSENFDWLVSCMIDFLFVADLAFSCLMYPGWAQ
jgi:predicted GNAT superfamily acetyltransferase